MHCYTDQLLTLIEESPVWKVALGFEKGTDEPVKNGGKKLVEHYRTIAKQLLVDDLSGRWSAKDVIKLGDAVKNRINWVKKTYTKARNELSETGQGLIDEDRESEIMADSVLESIWDKIKLKFPWYKRVHCLLKTSPVVNRSAVGHSMSELNLSVLRKSGSDPAYPALEEFFSQVDPSSLDSPIIFGF